MSTSSEFAVRLPQKRSFSRTYPLSRYFEENKVAPGDLTLSGKPITPMNLFPENSVVESILKNQPAQSLKSMDLIPQFADSSAKMFNAIEEHKTAQMTIFYAGQVIVFNDFPADKAKEIMLLASKGSNSSQMFAPQPAFAPKIPNSEIESNAEIPLSPTMSRNLFQDTLQWPVMPMAPPLPIARRSSLQRFLEKRRDRIIARSLCPVPAKSASSKPAENRSWLSSVAAKSASS